MNGLVPQENRALGSVNQAVAQQASPDLPVAAAAPKLSVKQQATMARVQQKAGIIKNLAFPAAMAVAIPVAQDIGTAAFVLYRDGLIRDAGSPTDPIEIMLIEQIALAHHRIGQLHAQAEQSKSVEESKVFMMAAVRLTGELRRLALALNQYRQPMPKRQFTIVKQQNVSRAGQQIAYFDRSNESQKQVPFDGDDAKLESAAALRIGNSPGPNGDCPKSDNDLRQLEG